jgi:hypothetical protein
MVLTYQNLVLSDLSTVNGVNGGDKKYGMRELEPFTRYIATVNGVNGRCRAFTRTHSAQVHGVHGVHGVHTVMSVSRKAIANLKSKLCIRTVPGGNKTRAE